MKQIKELGYKQKYATHCKIWITYFVRDKLYEVRGLLPEECKKEGVFLFSICNELELEEQTREMEERTLACLRLTSTKG